MWATLRDEVASEDAQAEALRGIFVSLYEAPALAGVTVPLLLKNLASDRKRPYGAAPAAAALRLLNLCNHGQALALVERLHTRGVEVGGTFRWRLCGEVEAFERGMAAVGSDRGNSAAVAARNESVGGSPLPKRARTGE